ncbi:ATP-dependent RNA helicase mitochondrial [Micractinium conductrix]|uniref:RNA helicase n=1 Tax=Micractinium conductrix TaxID=554055 RepID=A0A2P6VAL3_9CHLO|nr:ATP-dependent RNA helicase mitochondrial [Micractinium conductrix]|eukprot:PSC71108.1 ATP-dependent RNA helicase mitochondrial [Micractinium conductrix]
MVAPLSRALGGWQSGLLLPAACRALSAAEAAALPEWGGDTAVPPGSGFGGSSMTELTEAITDLANPSAFFPTARAMERRIVAHLGPTNSGKTHAALQGLRAARSGLYCGPLRLLAWQVHDQLSSSGLPCNLVTGQERRDLGAPHTACTTEMASTQRVLDVAVLDEVQMVADESRGWAFTRALLGLPARTLHVCGDPAALPLLERILAETGDTLEVRRYERLSPLAPARRPLTDLKEVRSGDCVVAFSRRDVHALRSRIEASGRHRCSVVYGALPPDARQQQASLFNTPRTGYNVLAASDAIGQGLNLAIRRVVFTSLRKFDGREEWLLTTSEVKQVAGRAGRYGGRFPSGVATACSAEGLEYLAHCLAQPSEPLQRAVLFPSLGQLELLSGLHPQDALPSLLRRFAEAAQGSLQDTHYSLADYSPQLALATMLRHLPLSLREAWTFSISPTDPEDVPVASALLHFATLFAHRRRVTPAAILHPPLSEARSEWELQQLEATHRVIDLYIWLAYRFADSFSGLEEAGERRRAVSALIDASIRAMGVQRGLRGKAAVPEADEAEL